jgi:hypothetical protein
MSTPHRALELLPRLGTTGIGSLPHTQLELGLQMAMQVDVPYLPQLPIGNPAEFMIPASLEGLPGLLVDAEGMCTVDVEAWRAGQADFGARLERALRQGELAAFEPSPQAYRAWQPFLWEVEHRKLALAKVQLSGPCTVRWVTRLSTGGAVSELPELEQQLFRLVLARALAMVKAVRRTGATPILYLDEPGLYALDVRNPSHLIALQELKLLATALQKEGALVGLHCCGNTTWEALLPLGFDLLSIDVRLSLGALVEAREAFLAFLEEGGALSLGVIPTNLDANYEVGQLVASVEATLRAVLPEGRVAEVLGRSLLTPACGLGMRTPIDAEQAFEDLKVAQRGLRKLSVSA